MRERQIRRTTTTTSTTLDQDSMYGTSPDSMINSRILAINCPLGCCLFFVQKYTRSGWGGGGGNTKMMIHSVGIIFKALLLVLTALTWDRDAQFSYWTGYCHVHQSDDDGSSGDYYDDYSDNCPTSGVCYDYCYHKCTDSGDGGYGGYPGCKGFEVGDENGRFGRSVLTMVLVVLILIISATTIHTAVRTIRENMNRSVGVAILLVMVEITTVTIAMTIGKKLFQRLPCW